MLSNHYKRVPLDQIRVQRAERQRREIEVGDLLESIRRRGVYNPIIVKRDLELIAGERRLEASRALGLADIPVRFADELSEIEAQLIELEENLKRKELPWRDMVKAMGQLWDLSLSENPELTQVAFAESLGYERTWITTCLRVYRELDSPRIAQASGVTSAYNILARVDERSIADAMSDILEAGAGLLSEPESLATEAEPDTTPPSATGIASSPAPAVAQAAAQSRSGIVPPDQSILMENFLEWAPQYSGPRFNFIHCDFPYGINVFSGPQSGSTSSDIYDDSPEIYWALIKCLGQNLDRLMSHSGHLMFWFSMEYYSETIEAFRQSAPSLILQPFPLVWFKSDNVGILPDPKRGPRRVYETAFIASREDRFILKPVANTYAAPTDKTYHTSTKPEPMLRHFFQMFVDEHTKMFDPTCGSGSSLRAAESMGAKHVLGLEIDPAHNASARTALRQFRLLRAAAK